MLDMSMRRDPQGHLIVKPDWQEDAKLMAILKAYGYEPAKPTGSGPTSAQ